MSGKLEQLAKLKGMTMREIRVRGGQEFAKLSDRFFLPSAGEMNDDALFSEFAANWRNGSGEGAAHLLRDRLRAKERVLLPAFEQQKAIVNLMNRRFPRESDAIIAAADKAIGGRLDLLGHEDLDFGAPLDWHGDPLSGRRSSMVHWSKIDPVNPLDGGDLKVVWELNRHAHFITLGQAYWLTKDNRYPEAFVDQVSDWIDSNPAGIGINWAASLEVSFRAIAWLWALHFCVDSNELSPDFIAKLTKSLIEHGRHIEKYMSYYFSPNTHLTGEALGLFYLGLALPELRRAEHWRKLGLRILLEQLPRHVRQDGVYFEQSSYYHRYTADFYTHLFVLVRAQGLMIEREAERQLWRKLELLLNHLMWITRPDGTTPFFGDDDGGRLVKLAPRAANDFRDTLAIGAGIYKRGDWKLVAGEAPAELLWLIGPEGIASYDGIKAEPQTETSQGFETSGYFVMRDGWGDDASFALIDCGRHGSEAGCGHAHADALALEFAANGTTWLVDPGTFIYAADAPTRDRFRSTGAHNTATVDGESQSVTSQPFGWLSTASGRLQEFSEGREVIIFEGSHDGYERYEDPVKHVRSVMFVKPDQQTGLPAYLIVRDRFSASKRHQYRLHYQLTSACEAQAGEGLIEAIHENGEVLTISVAGRSAAKAQVTDGWFSTCYARRAPAPSATFEAEGDGPQDFVTLIFPGTADQAAPLQDRIIQQWHAGEDFRLWRGGASTSMKQIGELEDESIETGETRSW